jgi:hypothetical protein
VLAVVAVIALVTAGGRAAADATAELVGTQVDVGETLTVHPAAGWSVRTPDESRAALLSKGTAAMVVMVASRGGLTAEQILEGYVTSELAPRLGSLALGEAQADSVQGMPSAEVGYVGVARGGETLEGVVIAIAMPSGAAVFDVAAPQGDLAAVAEDVVAMIEETEFR